MSSLAGIDWRGRAWIIYLAVGGLLTAAYLWFPPLKGSGPLINLLGLSSSVAIAVGIYLHRPKARAAWLLFIVGQFLFFAGDLYTYSYPKLFGAEVEFPSLGDAIYLTVYPALVAGLLLLVRRRNPQGDRAGVIDSLILTVGIALLSWVFLVAPNIHLSGLTLLEKAVSAAYPLGDILLLAAAIRLAVDKGKRAPAFYLLVGSIVSLLAVDSAYTYALLTDAYNHQLSYDVGWIAYYLLWGAAALHPSMRTLEEPALESRARLTPLRLGLLAGACLIAPGVRFYQAIDDPDVLVLIVASALLFLLVVARMVGLVRQEERAAARELALRRAGVELVAAGGREQVNEAAISAVLRARRRAGDVRLVSAGRRGRSRRRLLRRRRRMARLEERRTAGSASRPGRLSRSPLARLPEDVAGPASPRRRPRRARSCRSRFATRPAACSSCARRSRIPRELVDSLESLASQVSLAVEGASLAEDLHRRQSEARFRSLVAHSSDLITVLDAHGTVTYQSPSIERVLGYRADEIEGSDFARLLGEADRPRLAQILAGVGEAYVGGGSETHVIECSLRHRDGTWLQFEVQHTDLLQDEHVRGIVLNSRDVSERKAFEDQLAHQAFHDPVTSLANRALFADRVQHSIMRSIRGGPAIGVMFIDLDDFKTVNDSLGHAAGDTVLQEVAQRLAGRRAPGRHGRALRRRRVRRPARRGQGLARRPRTSPGGSCARSSSSSTSTASRSTRARASASASPATSSARPMPRSSCATPTSRCTWPSATARAAIASSSRRCTSAWSSGSSSRRSCSGRSSSTSSRSTTSRSSASISAATTASRRCCAGCTRRAARSRPPTSSRSPRRPG